MNWLKKLQDDLSRVDRFVLRGTIEDRAALNWLELMVLCLEDRRFFRHCGVDFRSIAREMIRLLERRRHGGASTIDMQFVRTATGYRKLNLKRKLYEVLLAILIQFRYRKRTILQSYLACAHFGSSLTGAQMTAQKLFSKNINDLCLTEAALMSAMLARPRPLQASHLWQRRIEKRAAYAIEVYRRGKLRLPQIVRSALAVQIPFELDREWKPEFPQIDSSLLCSTECNDNHPSVGK